MNALLENLTKLHTTPMGVDRIRKNVSLSATEDVVAWCREKILEREALLPPFAFRLWFQLPAGG